jgi:hypothetical protein
LLLDVLMPSSVSHTKRVPLSANVDEC